METGDYISDITRIAQATGWRPATSLWEGIARTIGHYRQHREQY